MKQLLRSLIAPLLILICSIIALSFATEHIYKLTEPQAVAMYNQLQLQKELLPNTDKLTAKQATDNLIMCDSLQRIIAIQYKALNDTTNKK